MTNKLFYSQVTQIHSLKLELQELDISEEERQHLSRLIDSSLHNTILDLILSELSAEEKKVFLDHLTAGDEDKIWKHLNSNIDQVEDKIKKAADDLSSELSKDIESIKKDAPTKKPTKKSKKQ